MSWILKLYLWNFEWANYEHFIISPYHIGGKNILWFFCLNAWENRNSRCAINDMENYQGNQCKLV